MMNYASSSKEPNKPGTNKGEGQDLLSRVMLNCHNKQMCIITILTRCKYKKESKTFYLEGKELLSPRVIIVGQIISQKRNKYGPVFEVEDGTSRIRVFWKDCQPFQEIPMGRIVLPNLAKNVTAINEENSFQLGDTIFVQGNLRMGQEAPVIFADYVRKIFRDEIQFRFDWAKDRYNDLIPN